ncbi:hypothetical protein GF362_04435 [Candidatus Dojkabacteria bacterium]|nr:hypothetical protein [Candidatus Dojkabacteria bacterium]
MNLKKLIRKFGYYSFFLVFIFSLIFTNVLAQDDGVSISTGDDDSRKIFLHIFPPSTIADLRKYGILRFAGYLGVIIVAVLLLETIFVIIKTAMEFSTDEAKEIEDAFKSTQNLWQGVGWALGSFIAYAGISIFLGTGNMFNWASKLYQCNTEILFRAEYRAAVINPDLFKDEVMIYCCSNLERVNIPEDERGEGRLSISSWHSYTYSRDLEAVGVGTKEDGGWLFIADPEGTGPNVIPSDVKSSQGCEEFTV